MNYSPETLARAMRAVRCSPFLPQLFLDLQKQRVALGDISGSLGVKNGYTTQALPELVIENSLMWLTQVGLLRREVDGQGLTDSFRLTPLGRQLTQKEQAGAWSQPAWHERLQDFFSHWWHGILT
ncbi:Npun_F0494 family protein [Synechococcus sp. PCC 6312]|uniref:Npun_F0494 family protein n=1 Tax=Synechococcus sp. (strain ATCC 27167 / PCC 6312) TaxID=195253 RepID=UPI00029EF30F|nr:Npun_F0494 family protein [Synechococcus sp. PCC 6312]AFY59812.1 hypothetical protein Syn6312_0591 [Synechococcus sp. PCC 6312]